MVGRYGKTMLYDVLDGLAAPTRGFGWSVEEVLVFLVGVRKSLHDNSVHLYLPFYAAYGQKPL
jgi:hypothetical protein